MFEVKVHVIENQRTVKISLIRVAVICCVISNAQEIISDLSEKLVVTFIGSVSKKKARYVCNFKSQYSDSKKIFFTPTFFINE